MPSPAFAFARQYVAAFLVVRIRGYFGHDFNSGQTYAAADDVKNGHGLSASLGKGKRFPRLAVQMIQVGEESGALDAMLLKTADTFEQETSVAMDRLPWPPPLVAPRPRGV